jgi:hypothetical protein
MATATMPVYRNFKWFQAELSRRFPGATVKPDHENPGRLAIYRGQNCKLNLDPCPPDDDDPDYVFTDKLKVRFNDQFFENITDLDRELAD